MDLIRKRFLELKAIFDSKGMEEMTPKEFYEFVMLRGLYEEDDSPTYDDIDDVENISKALDHLRVVVSEYKYNLYRKAGLDSEKSL